MKSPGGGVWIHFNKYMQMVKKPTEGGAVWSDGTTFAVSGCNLGSIGNPPNFDMHPVLKISFDMHLECSPSARLVCPQAALGSCPARAMTSRR